MPKLENAIRRFDAASNGRLLYLGIEWPLFGEYVNALHRYYEETTKVALPPAANAEVSMLFSIQRKLLALPMSPDHPAVGAHSVLQSSRVHLASDILTSHRDSVIEALQRLVENQHVAKDLVGLMTTKLRNVDVNGKSVAVLVPRGFKDLASEVVQIDGASSINFFSLTELRRAPIHDLVVLFGPPEQHLWHRDSLQDRRKSVSWVYSAPAAFDTVTLGWTGHTGYDLSSYSVWTEKPLSPSEVVGSVAFKATASVSATPVPRDAVIADLDGVDATLVDLVGGGSIAFHPEFGPKPQILEVEELEFEIRQTSAKALEPRHVLIFRTDDSEISFIRKTAKSSMGKTKYEKALVVSTTFKQNVRTAALLPTSVADLGRQGIANPDYYLNVVTDGRYIGPKDLETAQRIANALGFQISEGDFRLLTEMRSHHRTAGAKANELVRKALAESHEWEDAVSAGLQAHIDLRAVGTVVIAVVESIGTIKRKVSRLGIAEKLPSSEDVVMKIGIDK